MVICMDTVNMTIIVVLNKLSWDFHVLLSDNSQNHCIYNSKSNTDCVNDVNMFDYDVVCNQML